MFVKIYHAVLDAWATCHVSAVDVHRRSGWVPEDEVKAKVQSAPKGDSTATGTSNQEPSVTGPATEKE